MKSEYSSYLKQLASELPEIIWRDQWEAYRKQFKMPFTLGMMTNLDSQEKGPKLYSLQGRVYYNRADFIAWLNQFIENPGNLKLLPTVLPI